MAISGDLFKLVHFRTLTISTDVWWQKLVWSVCSQGFHINLFKFFHFGTLPSPPPTHMGTPFPYQMGTSPSATTWETPSPNLFPVQTSSFGYSPTGTLGKRAVGLRLKGILVQLVLTTMRLILIRSGWRRVTTFLVCKL